jgi:hypothetical protein
MMVRAQGRDLDHLAVRNALQAVVIANHGVLNPRQVVEAARDPASMLHRFFEWDDTAAAEAYRLAQVGALVRRVKLTILRTEQATRAVTITTTRGYQSRPSQRRRDGGYESITDLLTDADKRRELLGQVLGELGAYRRRYAALVELDAVWTALDEVTAEAHEDSLPDAPGDETARPGAAG